MFKYIALGLAAGVLSGNPAMAQDATAFTGAHVDATVGLDQLRFDVAQLGGTGRKDTIGAGYGVSAGYDVALSPTLVAGVDVGLNLSGNSFASGTTTTGNYLRERRELTVAGRLGVPITPNALLYGTAGYANQQVRLSQTAAGVTTGGLRDLDGVLVGAGLEVKLSPQAYVKSEYRYTNYQDGYTSNKVLTGIGLRF